MISTADDMLLYGVFGHRKGSSPPNSSRAAYRSSQRYLNARLLRLGLTSIVVDLSRRRQPGYNTPLFYPSALEPRCVEVNSNMPLGELP